MCIRDSSNSLYSSLSKIKNIFFGWVKDNYDKAFLLVLATAFLAYLFVFFKTLNQPLWYDAANYLATAKRLVFPKLGLNDIWYYRRGFFWALFPALFFALGLGEAGVRLSLVFFGSGIVLTSYLLLSKMFDKKKALISSIGVAFSWIVLFFVGRPLTDIPACFFLLLSLLFFWKGYVLKEGKKYLFAVSVKIGRRKFSAPCSLQFRINTPPSTPDINILNDTIISSPLN